MPDDLPLAKGRGRKGNPPAACRALQSVRRKLLLGLARVGVAEGIPAPRASSPRLSTPPASLPLPCQADLDCLPSPLPLGVGVSGIEGIRRGRKLIIKKGDGWVGRRNGHLDQEGREEENNSALVVWLCFAFFSVAVAAPLLPPGHSHATATNARGAHSRRGRWEAEQ